MAALQNIFSRARPKRASELTDQQKKAIVDAMYVGATPAVDAAYKGDPRTQLAEGLLATGRNTAPLTGGVTEGIARVLSGGAGGYFSDKQRRNAQVADEAAQGALMTAREPTIREAAGQYNARSPQANLAMSATPPPPAPAGPMPGMGPGQQNAASLAAVARNLGGGQPSAAPPQVAPPGPAPGGGMPGQGPNPALARVAQNLMPQQQGAPGAPTLAPNPPLPGVSPVSQPSTQQQGYPSNRASVSVPPAASTPAAPTSRQQVRSSLAAFNQFATGFLGDAEGGYNPRDSRSGAPVNFGIDQRANPDIDVKNLTRQQANQLMYDRYWKPSGAGNITDPALQAIHADTAINMGVATAARLLEQAEGSPERYLALREQRYRNLGGPELEGWLNRNDKLARYTGTPLSSGVGGDGLGDLGVNETGQRGPSGAEPVPGAPVQEVPGLPDAPARPGVPQLGDRVRSARMEVAARLLDQRGSLNPALLGALMEPEYQQGMTEEQASRVQRQKDEYDLTRDQWQNDLGLYRDQTRDRSQAQIEDHSSARDANEAFRQTEYEGNVQRGRDITENRWNIDTREDTQSWSAEQARLAREAAEERAQVSREAKIDNFVNTAHGTKVSEAINASAESASDALASLDQFSAAMRSADTGGMMGIEAVRDGVGTITNNSAYGEMDRISASLLEDIQANLKGSMSDTDRTWIQGSLPSSRNSYKKNEGAITAMRRAAERQFVKNRLELDAIGRGGNQGLIQFRQRWYKYISEVSLNPATGKQYADFETWDKAPTVR